MNNLQDLVLVKITNYIENDIDRISIALTCKKLFNIRNKLNFNCNGCTLSLDLFDKRCSLNSFKTAIKKSLQYKINLTMFDRNRKKNNEISISDIELSSNNNTPIRSPPSPVVYDLLALSSTHQSSPSAARSYTDAIKSLRFLKQQINNTTTTNSLTSIINSNENTTTTTNTTTTNNNNNIQSKILELDENINPETSSFTVLPTHTLRDIPIGTTHLTFAPKFNRFIPPNSLPSTLTHITFGYNFNFVLLPDTIPPTVTNLVFNFQFNQTIGANILPNSIQYLTFGNEFNSKIETLPNNLLELTFKSEYNQVIEPNWLPQSLITFRLLNFNYQHILKVGSLPEHLETLEMTADQPFEEGVLPNTLKHLVLGNCYNRSLSTLPPSVRVLTFGQFLNDSPNLFIPFNSLIYLTTLTFLGQTFRIRFIDDHNIFILNRQFIGGFINSSVTGLTNNSFLNLFNLSVGNTYTASNATIAL